jgi:hypothetical protein
MNIVIIFSIGIHLLGSIDFEISIVSRILCILLFLIIRFLKKFKNVTLVFFTLKFLVRNINLEHDL